MKLTVAMLICGGLAAAHSVERWRVYEVTLAGPAAGNPFVDVRLQAAFHFRNRIVTVDGFYDGNSTYRIRFMPDEIGEWNYETSSNAPELNGKRGSFAATAPSAANHGPARVRYTTHFAYEDGTPYIPIGTTAYAWIHQGDELEKQTLETLRSSPFNKIRMCILPKDYLYNKNEPVYYPFERSAGGTNDYTRFVPQFWAHLERRILDLQALGIEADLILFHPYDRWGYNNMPADANDLYLRYVVARLAAYRNVWWSMANEWDFVRTKNVGDWDRFFRIVQESDPYAHLRSIHQGNQMYDHAKPWITHVSWQGSDMAKIREFVQQYRKPVIDDECQYEGTIPSNWGNISAQELVRRFWMGTVGGGYVGHGETYLDPNDILWWSKGGKLKGQSPARIAFLRKILEAAPPEGLNSIPGQTAGAGQPGQYYLFYFDSHQPAESDFNLAPGTKYRADIIDPWEMTITPVPGTFEGRFTLKLPGKPYLAVRFHKGD